jgi:hypothetical protein
MATHLGSLPWLFPLHHGYFPQPIVYHRASKRTTASTSSSAVSSVTMLRKGSGVSSDSITRESLSRDELEGLLNCTTHTHTHSLSLSRMFMY